MCKNLGTFRESDTDQTSKSSINQSARGFSYLCQYSTCFNWRVLNAFGSGLPQQNRWHDCCGIAENVKAVHLATTSTSEKLQTALTEDVERNSVQHDLGSCLGSKKCQLSVRYQRSGKLLQDCSTSHGLERTSFSELRCERW